MTAMPKPLIPTDETASEPPKYSPVLYNIQKDLGVRKKTGELKLKRLKPLHREMIAMHLSGMPSTEIAAGLDVAYVTVCRILNDPLAVELINGFSEMSKKEFDALRFKANAALRDGLDHTSIQTRLRAADLFSKRAGDYHPREVDDGDTAEDVIQRLLNLNLQVNVEVNTEKQQ